MLDREQLIKIGISSEDADKILAQYNAQEVTKVEVVKELPLPTSSDITSASQLSEYAKGQIIRLPEFASGQPFVVKLRRPSMMVLVKNGKIPNTLLETASSLFEGKSKQSKSKGDSEESQNAMKDIYDVLKIFAEAALISPTMAEIEEAGVELTDEQLIAIFNYSQSGINGLKSFRKE